MSYLILDVESTTKNKGHPFTPSNKLCTVGLRYFRGDEDPIERIYKIEYDDEPFGEALAEIQEFFDERPVVVGFNFKFDLHWLRRYGITWDHNLSVHDCQLAYFIETFQQNRLPSLDEAAAHYGLPAKLDVVKTEYWDKGIDTPQIPWDILASYLRQDVDITEQMYFKQLEFLEAHPKLRRLFRLQCQDLVVLEEMEWNGLPYDVEDSNRRSADLDKRISDLTGQLDALIGLPCVNWNSPDHVSSVLYGGTIDESRREAYLFHYKDPKREPVWKERWITITHTLPRLVEPLPNTSLQKEGKWGTGEPVLKELSVSAKGSAAAIIKLLLQLAELTTLKGFFDGNVKLIGEMEWYDHVLHGNLNQCNVITGRLSSNKPNLQNQPEDVHECIRSRF